jgi:hypothetical protein
VCRLPLPPLMLPLTGCLFIHSQVHKPPADHLEQQSVTTNHSEFRRSRLQASTDCWAREAEVTGLVGSNLDCPSPLKLDPGEGEKAMGEEHYTCRQTEGSPSFSLTFPVPPMSSQSLIPVTEPPMQRGLCSIRVTGPTLSHNSFLVTSSSSLQHLSFDMPHLGLFKLVRDILRH